MELHSKASLLNPEKELVESKEPPTSPMMASVAAMESKIEQLTTIVKSAQKTEASNAKSREQSPKVTPKKSTGPGTSAAGPFNKGKKPICCWCCGGWRAYLPRMSHPGKRQLAGVEWVQGPSSNQHQTRPETETIKRGIPGGRGISNKEEPMISKVTWGERNKVVKAAVKEI